jgi:uncharacterized protein
MTFGNPVQRHAARLLRQFATAHTPAEARLRQEIVSDCRSSTRTARHSEQNNDAVLRTPDVIAVYAGKKKFHDLIHPGIVMRFRAEDSMSWPAIAPIVLLFMSNVFMTFAWYGQLKFPNAPLVWVIPVCWGIAFFEYCLAVPANRIGYTVYSGAQLKTIQEVITLVVFAVFSTTYLGEALRWNHMVAFALLAGAAFFAFHRW